MYKHILTISLILFLFNCVKMPPILHYQERLALLNQELSNWQSFKITGNTELQYQAFTIRGQAVLLKTENKFRFDILNQSIFGLGGGVLMAVYVDDEEVQARLFGSSAIETFELDSGHGRMISFLSESLFQSLYDQREIIIETFEANYDGFLIQFNSNMQLTRIYNSQQNIGADFEYDRNNNLTELKLLTPITRNFIIHVDKIEYENIVVNPLK